MSSRKQLNKNTKNEFKITPTSIHISNNNGDWVEVGELGLVEGTVSDIDLQFNSTEELKNFIEKLQEIYGLMQKNV